MVDRTSSVSTKFFQRSVSRARIETPDCSVLCCSVIAFLLASENLRLILWLRAQSQVVTMKAVVVLLVFAVAASALPFGEFLMRYNKVTNRDVCLSCSTGSVYKYVRVEREWYNVAIKNIRKIDQDFTGEGCCWPLPPTANVNRDELAGEFWAPLPCLSRPLGRSKLPLPWRSKLLCRAC